jgi:hypothetical protein
LRVLYECGLSTEQALHVFAKEQRGVLPDVALEIGEVTRRVSAGSDLSEATRSVAAEAGDAELSDLFAMIRQIDRYGGAVQEPLQRFGNLLEDRERTRLQEAIGRLSAKLTIVMVLFLLPALLTFVGGPGFVAGDPRAEEHQCLSCVRCVRSRCARCGLRHGPARLRRRANADQGGGGAARADRTDRRAATSS